jgi:hypothetical protein
MINAEVVELTPEIALELLKNNRINRPLSQATIDKYVRAIKRGEWALNGEPIIVFETNNIGSGQHRCHAVIKSGIAIDTVLMRGVKESTFGTLDTGKPRGASDVLSIGGHANSHRLATAARNYLLLQPKGKDLRVITNLQIESCVANHPHLHYWVKKYCSMPRARIFPAFICTYLAIASEKYGFEKLDKFFEDISIGANLDAYDPAFVLRDRFIAQTKSSRLSTPHQKAFIVKAINSHLLNKKLKILRFTEGETTPEII